MKTHRSPVHLAVVTVATLGLVLSLAVPPSTAQTPKLVYIDTVSGADQQFLFNTFVIPEAKRELKVDVEYVVSSATEIIQRLKAQAPGKGDLHVISLFSEGDPPGTDGYVVVPSAIPDAMKPLAYRLVNFVMSDKVMLKLVTDNWLLPGTDIWDLVPKEVWTHIPHPSKSRALSIQSKEALDYLRKRGMEHFR